MHLSIYINLLYKCLILIGLVAYIFGREAHPSDPRLGYLQSRPSKTALGHFHPSHRAYEQTFPLSTDRAIYPRAGISRRSADVFSWLSRISRPA